MTARSVTGRTAAVPRRLMAGFWAALGFLTVLPVPERRAGGGHPMATAFFPWVGAGLGALAAVVARAPVDPAVAGVLALTTLFLLTGGLHWDGWADVLDATLGPALSRDKRISILADPRIGAHAAVGVTLLVVLAVSALARAPVWGIVLGAVAGRWAMVACLCWAPALRASGAAARLRDHAHPVAAGVGLGAIVGLCLAGGVVPGALAAALGAGLLAAALFATVLVRRLGGMNGDGHGAVGLLTETVIWLVAAETTGWMP